MHKPHRLIGSRVGGYADDASAYLRRRRRDRRPFIRLYAEGGAGIAVDPESPEGRPLATAAAALLDASRD